MKRKFCIGRWLRYCYSPEHLVWKHDLTLVVGKLTLILCWAKTQYAMSLHKHGTLKTIWHSKRRYKRLALLTF